MVLPAAKGHAAWWSPCGSHAAYLALGGGLSAHYGAVLLAIFTFLPEATFG